VFPFFSFFPKNKKTQKRILKNKGQMLGRIAMQLRPRASHLHLASTRSIASFGADFPQTINQNAVGSCFFSSMPAPFLTPTDTHLLASHAVLTPALPMSTVAEQLRWDFVPNLMEMQRDCNDLLDSAIWLASVKRKRKSKMNKHKLRKLRRKTRMSTKR
jgi:hypothetical protein